MKKIGVYLGNEPYWGGAFQYNQSILEALSSLDKSKYEIWAIYIHPLWEEYLSRYDFKLKHINRYRWKNLLSVVIKKVLLRCNIGWHKYRWLFGKIDLNARVIDSCDMDLVLFPSQEHFAVFQRTPAISVIHDLMHRYEDFPEVTENGEYVLREQSYSAICNVSAGIFVDSEIGKYQVAECYGDQYLDKLYVLPFTPPQYLFYEKETKPKENLPEKYIFYPAQFWKHKNHENLIRAIVDLRKDNIIVNLVLVGSQKNGYESICRLIDKIDLQSQIFILGYVSNGEMKYLYKHARAMVMPTFFGPTNIPPLEAMAVGCPVAVSNVYGMPDMIGNAGLTFDPHSVTDIAECVKELWLYDDVCEEFAEKGKERSKLFSQNEFNKKFKNHIDNILEYM